MSFADSCKILDISDKLGQCIYKLRQAEAINDDLIQYFFTFTDHTPATLYSALPKNALRCNVVSDLLFCALDMFTDLQNEIDDFRRSISAPGAKPLTDGQITTGAATLAGEGAAR